MAKSADRLFHLTVAAFAGVLTVLSTITAWEQHQPGRFRQWLGHLPQPAWLQGWNALPPHAPATPSGETSPSGTAATDHATHSANTASPLAAPASPRPQNDLAQIRIINRGASAATVEHVRNLIQQNNLPGLVSGVLNEHLRGPVQLYLAQTAGEYKSVLASLGVSPEDAARFTRDTGGFTQDSTVVVPLYQNTTDPDLVNTLAHELTHVYLNQNVGDLPSWIDEGLAVYVGMSAQRKVQDPVAYEGYAKQAAEDVISAAAQGKLVPLTADESAVLSGGQPYDLELQDWMAVADLIRTHGSASVHRFLQAVAGGTSAGAAFRNAFGEDEATLNRSLENLLTQAAKASDHGVDITVVIDSGYTGELQVLQHGSQLWRGIAAAQGRHRITVLPDGSIVADLRLTSKTQDSQPADAQTLYIDLDPAHSLTYQGQRVDDCGFAIDVHHGIYAFVNSWVTTAKGKSTYLDTPSLFGVHIVQVQDRAPSPLEWLWTSSGAQ